MTEREIDDLLHLLEQLSRMAYCAHAEGRTADGDHLSAAYTHVAAILARAGYTVVAQSRRLVAVKKEEKHG